MWIKLKAQRLFRAIKMVSNLWPDKRQGKVREQRKRILESMRSYYYHFLEVREEEA